MNIQSRKLKMPILWKWDEDNIADLPKNVMIQKWVPQQDILAHPNLKLFVTHGGLLRYSDKSSLLSFIFGQPFCSFTLKSGSQWPDLYMIKLLIDHL